MDDPQDLRLRLHGTVSGRAREDNFQAYGAGFTLLIVDTFNHRSKFYEAGPRAFLVWFAKELTNKSRGT